MIYFVTWIDSYTLSQFHLEALLFSVFDFRLLDYCQAVNCFSQNRFCRLILLILVFFIFYEIFVRSWITIKLNIYVRIYHFLANNHQFAYPTSKLVFFGKNSKPRLAFQLKLYYCG